MKSIALIALAVALGLAWAGVAIPAETVEQHAAAAGAAGQGCPAETSPAPARPAP